MRVRKWGRPTIDFGSLRFSSRPLMRVTFIVAACNIQNYIEECILNVVSCVRPDDELIVVNDGSTDATLDLAQRAIQGLANASIIDKPNGGLSSARNVGLELAQGDYVLFVDGDDVLISAAVQSLRQILDEQQPDVLVTDYFDWLDDGRGPLRRSRPRSHPAHTMCNDVRRNISDTLLDSIPCVWTRFFKRTLFEDMGTQPFPEWSMYDDLPVTPHVIARAQSLLYVPTPMVQYRVRAGSLTKARTARSCLDMVKAAAEAAKVVHRHPQDAHLQATADLFVVRKFVEAVKQSRQVPGASVSMFLEMLNCIDTARFNRALALLRTEQHPHINGKQISKNIQMARYSRHTYAILQWIMVKIKWRRSSKKSNN
jgi:glycosyltransferase involved in cell wall biosynthesis